MHRLASGYIVNTPNILILCVISVAFLGRHRKDCFQRTFWKLNHKIKACTFIPQNGLSQNSNEEMVITRPFETCRLGRCIIYLRQGDGCAWAGGALKLPAALPHLLVKSRCQQNQKPQVERGAVGVSRRDEQSSERE